MTIKIEINEKKIKDRRGTHYKKREIMKIRGLSLNPFYGSFYLHLFFSLVYKICVARISTMKKKSSVSISTTKQNKKMIGYQVPNGVFIQ